MIYSEVKDIERAAARIRYNIVRMIGACHTGHLGGSCSLADIAAVLYGHVMNYDPKNVSLPERDRFLLSKGHAALVQYAAMAEIGCFPEEELDTLKKLGSRLQGHPDCTKLPGIEANTGSLGQGLSIACGMAAGLRLSGNPARVYCIMGDGEQTEGQLWEAAMSATAYRLDNLTAVIDCNGLQATGAIRERFDTGDLRAKWEAFGWRVLECDGHSVPALIAAFSEAKTVRDRATVILAHTVKGKGVDFAENVVAFHNGAMTQEQYDHAISVLGGQK